PGERPRPSPAPSGPPGPRRAEPDRRAALVPGVGPGPQARARGAHGEGGARSGRFRPEHGHRPARHPPDRRPRGAGRRAGPPGKPSDGLLLQEQDAVAAALGDADADALMARLATAARTIAWTSDDAWERIGSSLQGPRGRVAAADRPLGAGLVLREGVVELAPG